MKASTESVTGPHVVSQYVESLVKSKFTHIEIQDFEYIIHNAPNSHYQTPLSQIHFLCFLISILDVKNVLEIGTYKGFTTQCFAAAVGGRGRVATIDHNVTNIRIATELWKKNSIHNIDSHTGLAIEQMNNMVQDKKLFDLIYIDADKDSYNHYFNLALQLAHPTHSTRQYALVRSCSGSTN